MSGGGGSKGMDFLSVARELGAEKSLKKPFDPRELIDAVRALSRQATPLSAPASPSD